jgi:4a-hydroxytetrahydrobiopterin dehydratase|tara:strand:+ start:5017 stop:5364 length:348 start_codon:yes stop_codon:yes gene_type:complete
MSDMPLGKRNCVPCEAGVPPLKKETCEKLLEEIGGHWKINQEGRLFCSYKFGDFIKAMNFANKVGLIAEDQGHHPYLGITWGVCDITIWTHAIDGLSESDFILAAHVETFSRSSN